MARRKHSPEQVITKLRQAEMAIAEDSTVVEASRQIGVTRSRPSHLNPTPTRYR